jgi:cation diffusion facilitator family transporter
MGDVYIDYFQRGKEGKKAAIIGIVGNLFLTTFNITIGIFSGSFALVAEGAHTLSDIATSIIAFIGFKIGQKPADIEHPLGHGRAESIAGLVIVMFLAFIAYEIITGSIEKLFFKGSIVAPTYLAAVMALFGIFVNIGMSKYIQNIGKKINSPAIIADGKHQQMDIFSCIAILISVILSQLGYTFLDPIVGIMIGLFVLKAGFEVGKDNINNIMGKIPSKSLIDEIESITHDINGICGIHNIRINYFGSYATLTLHIDIKPDLSLQESHRIIHQAQNDIIKKIDIIQLVVAHACPLGDDYDNDENLEYPS